ncbi:type 1 fimbrial protein [Enterobacteriaceae bacterium 4M9]|nr:type 1 fimbrial protein [Enterobacteriaceae bacterium 4M9]
MSKMKFAVCALALGVSAAANAAVDGTVTFNGKLVAETCTVANDSKAITVQLPTVAVQTLTGPGEEVGSTRFEINVTDCPAGVTHVAAHFEAINSSGADPVTGNLVNSSTEATPAEQVQVRLYNITDNTQIKVGETGEKFEVNNQAATLSYAGGYYATGQTTAGPVTAKVQYVLAYP